MRYCSVLLALILGSAANADDVLIGAGSMLNNIERTGSGPLIDVTARKSGLIHGLDGHIGLTHVIRSDFGNHHGSAQFVTAGLAKPWVLQHDMELRAGGGLLVAVHYAWGDHYKPPMEDGATYKAECLFCGYFLQGSVSWKRLELTLRYTSTDPNLWTSYNGAIVMLAYRL